MFFMYFSPDKTDLGLEKARRCLMCQETFPSSWPGERICRRCRSSANWKRG